MCIGYCLFCSSFICPQEWQPEPSLKEREAEKEIKIWNSEKKGRTVHPILYLSF